MSYLKQNIAQVSFDRNAVSTNETVKVNQSFNCRPTNEAVNNSHIFTKYWDNKPLFDHKTSSDSQKTSCATPQNLTSQAKFDIKLNDSGNRKVSQETSNKSLNSKMHLKKKSQPFVSTWRAPENFISDIDPENCEFFEFTVDSRESAMMIKWPVKGYSISFKKMCEGLQKIEKVKEHFEKLRASNIELLQKKKKLHNVVEQRKYSKVSATHSRRQSSDSSEIFTPNSELIESTINEDYILQVIDSLNHKFMQIGLI